jgi:TIR domain/Pentapeptide repeats (8 copies)
LRNASWILKNLPPLNHVNLDDANMCRVDLSWVNLHGSSLRATQLSESNLSCTNFTQVSLRGANLAGAHLGETIFADSDLSEVQGLETVWHNGPSEISVATLYRSSGKTPGFHQFLLGIGVPEALISYLPSLAAQATEYYSCFISYSHEDKSFTHQLHEQLVGRGIPSWLDEKQIHPGDEIYAEVDRGIRLWDKMLVCCSKNSLIS